MNTTIKIAIAAILFSTASAFAGNVAYGCNPVVVVKSSNWQAQPVAHTYQAPARTNYSSACSTVKVVKPSNYASSCNTVVVVKPSWTPVKKSSCKKTNRRGRFAR